jgi:hypothetical protein
MEPNMDDPYFSRNGGEVEGRVFQEQLEFSFSGSVRGHSKSIHFDRF